MKTKPTACFHLDLPGGHCLAALIAAVLTLPAAMAAPAPPAANYAPRPSEPIPIEQLGAVAGKQYQGDGLSVTATPDGARLRCVFQKLEGHATSQGLWLESTEPGAAGKLRLTATALRRGELSTQSATLPATGTVTVADQLARFIRPGLTEEYLVSVDGVRQDFIIAQRPGGEGQLRLELDVVGAKTEPLVNGARLVLDGSGRKLAYNRLRVVDARGRELTAHLEVTAATHLAVLVNDANATYPVRIDPTFSDADWVSLNPGMPGTNKAKNGSAWGVFAFAVDGSGNVYFGGGFSFIGTVPANSIVKWDGSSWSVLGSGVNIEGGQREHLNF